MQSLVTFDPNLKEFYEVGLRNAIQNANPVLAEVQKNTRDIVGREAVWSIHARRSKGTGSRPENVTLPAPGFQGFTDPRERLKYHYHRISVSGPAEALTSNDKGAFSRALESELMGGENDLKNNLSRQASQGRFTVHTATPTIARTGVIALLNDNNDSADVVFATADRQKARIRSFFVGQAVDVINVTTGVAVTDGTNRTIQAIDRNTWTITLDASVDTIADGTAGLVVNGAYNAEFAGLPGLINDSEGDKVNGTNNIIVHNISAADEPVWASQVLGSDSAPISEFLIDEAYDAIQVDGDGRDDEVRLVVGAVEQRRALANKMTTQRRMTPQEAATPVAGTRGLDLQRGVLVTDKYALDNDLFFINASELEWFVGLDFGLENRDGNTLRYAGVGADGVDAFTGSIRAYTTLAVTNRNSHARVKLQPVT